ncbi:polysaccharide biosynthesis tyrosine autokinase [Umboniibacter marinipuniceus]|uniref:Tyrosine-protein kinase Etk/Wzc n=1 Tax=Umboniibacter marinipuniceus TaxID=569599 RepID=A0A3M0A7M8_9GAMM|nr:polysaccharide biosynthesis tyrosine autokinase [Umboniibacter marinipuniceus]RMA79549.1 tyrosine-protein kinase Etk/Wzc [Umboniibacter marinipuniceus]
MTDTVSNQSNRASSQNDEIDLGVLFGTLLDGKYWIVAVTAFFAVVGVMIALLSTPIYRADALLQVEEKSSGLSSLTEGLGDMFSAEGSAVTEIEILKSRMVIGRTVDELGLTNVAAPSYFPVVGRGLNRLFGEPRSIRIDTLGVSDDLLGKALRLELLEADRYRLYGLDDELLFEAAIGELVNESGVALQVGDIVGSPGDEFLVKKEYWLEVVTDLQKRLSVSERGKQSGILSLAIEGEDSAKIESILDHVARNYEAQNVARESQQAEKSINFLEQQLPDVRSRLESSEEDLNAYRQSRESVDLNREAEALLEVIVDLESQLNDLSFREAEISQRFTTSHPAYKALLENRKTLEKQRVELDARIRELPETQREVLRRSRELQVNQEVYTLLLNRTQELNVVRAGTVGFVRILDNAKSALKPVKPKKPLIAVLATLLGGMLGVAIVLVRSFMNKGLESTDGVEALGLPVYGNIPNSPAQKALTLDKAKDIKLLSLENPADLSVEAIRSLRTSLHFSLMDAPNNVVMITGPSPAAGKSFVSANLGMSLALSGHRVVVVDADMRKGHMEKELRVDKSPGLSGYLQGLTEIDELVCEDVGAEGFSFVPRGEVPPNPSELLMHERMGALMVHLSNSYDIVIVDTPPVLAVTDPTIVGKYSGVNLLIGRFNLTTLKEVEIAMQRFEQSGVKLNAFVLNGVEETARTRYNYAYYHYNYESNES